MTRKTVRIAMNGVTGRMGYRQHLVRSLLAIREQGGLDLGDGTVLWPEPVLVGRREHALQALAERHGLTEHISTDLDAALADPTVDIYFDAQVTAAREKAIQTGDRGGQAHLHREADRRAGLDGALELARLADGRRHQARRGAGQALPARPAQAEAAHRRRLLRPDPVRSAASSATGSSRATGRRPSARPGTTAPRTAAASSWTCSRTGTTCCDELFGRGDSPCTRTIATHIPQRWDEQGEPYDATADDAAYGIFELDGGAVAQINSSWAVRVNRDELVEFQVDGTEGRAVAGLRNCRVQHRVDRRPSRSGTPTSRPPSSFRDQWQEVPDNDEFDNGFKAQWELFLRARRRRRAVPLGPAAPAPAASSSPSWA